MRKILIFLLVTSFVLNLNCVSFAQTDGTLECSNITFTDDLGNAVTALALEPVTAKVTVFNGTGSDTKPTLMVCSYQNNKLNGIWYKASDNVITAGNSADVYVNFTPVTADENTVIEATVVDSIIKLNAPIASARMLKSSTALEGIIVGGNRISEYSDEVNDYLFKVTGNDAKVVAQAADGGTKVEIIQPEALPDTSTINITAADGTERNINVTVYNNEEQLYSLTKLCYEVNGVKYEVENFDPNVTEYTIELPKNTFYATVIPEALDLAETSVTITDINHRDKTFDGVSYFLDTKYTHRSVTRPAIDNVVPIKNEETDTTITVVAAGEQKKYAVKFVAQQPRLTEFKLGDGSYQETEKPYFISGAALNNDNGTAVGADRNTWTLGGISKPLVGASMISLASVTSGRDAASWQATNTSGEWCSFKADTDGTIYLITGSPITNTAYYNEDNGWEKVTNGTYTKIVDGVSLKANENVDAYCIYNIQWKTQADSYTLEGITNPSGLTVGVYANVYKKSFKAGELVSIHHPGYNTGLANSVGEAAIVWDLPQE